MNAKEFSIIAEVIRDRKHKIQDLQAQGWNEREAVVAQATLENLQLFMEMALREAYPKTFHCDKFMRACAID